MVDNEKIDLSAQIKEILQDLEDLASQILKNIICLKILTNPGDMKELINELEEAKK